VVGFVDASGIKVSTDLAENIVVARFLEVGLDDFEHIGFGFFACLAQLFRRPLTYQLVAPRPISSADSTCASS
jgi:hypothetical protein